MTLQNKKVTGKICETILVIGKRTTVVLWSELGGIIFLGRTVFQVQEGEKSCLEHWDLTCIDLTSGLDLWHNQRNWMNRVINWHTCYLLDATYWHQLVVFIKQEALNNGLSTRRWVFFKKKRCWKQFCWKTPARVKFSELWRQAVRRYHFCSELMLTLQARFFTCLHKCTVTHSLYSVTEASECSTESLHNPTPPAAHSQPTLLQVLD